MGRGVPTFFSGVVEGPVDEAALRRMASVVGANILAVYVQNGKSHLLSKFHAYNDAARHANWFVLLDLDHDAACAPEFLQERLSPPSVHMRARVAVREIEAWFLADRERVATYLSVPIGKIPERPDEVEDVKQTLVDIARASRKREIRAAIVPTAQGRREVGPGYVGAMTQFVEIWDPIRAARQSPSLDRALRAMRW